MTPNQQEIIKALIDGGNVAIRSRDKYAVRDSSFYPLRTFGFSTFYQVKKLCRKLKSGYYVADLKKIRSLHGKHFAKKYYKQQLKKKRQ